MATTFQAVKFIMLDFDGNWARHHLNQGNTLLVYGAMDQGCTLAVVAEEDGKVYTYWYTLGPQEEVWVVGEVVHIPGRKPKRKNGNLIDFA